MDAPETTKSQLVGKAIAPTVLEEIFSLLEEQDRAINELYSRLQMVTEPVPSDEPALSSGSGHITAVATQLRQNNADLRRLRDSVVA